LEYPLINKQAQNNKRDESDNEKVGEKIFDIQKETRIASEKVKV